MTYDYEDLVDMTKLAHGALRSDAAQLRQLLDADHEPWLGSARLGNGQELHALEASDGQGVVMQREQAIEFVHRVLDWQLEQGVLTEAEHEQLLTETIFALSTGL